MVPPYNLSGGGVRRVSGVRMRALTSRGSESGGSSTWADAAEGAVR